jgi:uncharacterized protein YggE/Kef-type K+ transport system membrane component KefB
MAVTAHGLTVQLFLQLAVILAACRLCGWLGRRLGQTQVVSEMVAGVLLGPSLFGLLAPAAQAGLFPEALAGGGPHPSMLILYALSQLGLVLYMFMIGLEFNHRLILGRVRHATLVSGAGILAPLALGGLAALVLRGDADLFAPHVTPGAAALYLGAAMSITAFPMLARILHETGIARTRMGTLALAAGSSDDAAAWCLLALVLSYLEGSWLVALFALGGGALYVLVMLTLARPILRALDRAVDADGRLGAGAMVTALLVLLLGAFATDAIGIYAVFGAFVAGLAMPRGRFAPGGDPPPGSAHHHAPAPRLLRPFRAQHPDRPARLAGGLAGRDHPGDALHRGQGRGVPPRGARCRRAVARVGDDRGAHERAGADGADHPQHRPAARRDHADPVHDHGADGGRHHGADGDRHHPDDLAVVRARLRAPGGHGAPGARGVRGSTRLGAALPLAFGLVLSACTPMAGPDGFPRRAATVTVSGVGTVTASPDMAEITTGVVTQAPTAAQALGANSQAMEKVLQSLAALGVAARDVQTTNIGVSPQHRPGKDDGRPPEIVGYEVTNQVRVKVRDLGRLGRVLDQQVGQGANSVYGIRFGLADPAPLLDEARKRAMADARRRADLYAAAAALRVGRVVAVQEAGAAAPRPETAPRVMMSAAVPVAPGEQEIQASVSVTFSLEP